MHEREGGVDKGFRREKNSLNKQGSWPCAALHVKRGRGGSGVRAISGQQAMHEREAGEDQGFRPSGIRRKKVGSEKKFNLERHQKVIYTPRHLAICMTSL
jgi:hypothetical protein